MVVFRCGVVRVRQRVGRGRRSGEPMRPLMDGKVALITGAASGIGRASAILFAAEGAAVVISDLDADGLAETAATIEATGGASAQLVADISDETTATQLVALADSHFGRLDCAHNNA